MRVVVKFQSFIDQRSKRIWVILGVGRNNLQPVVVKLEPICLSKKSWLQVFTDLL